MVRQAGVAPATSSLATTRSTVELLPQKPARYACDFVLVVRKGRIRTRWILRHRILG